MINYKLRLRLLASIFYIIGIWEIYIISQNTYKNNYEYIAYIYTIIKSILNILFGSFILNYIDYKKYNNLMITVAIIVIVNNIYVINMLCNLEKYEGVFEQVIMIEFLIVYIQSMILMILIIYTLIKMYCYVEPRPNHQILNHKIPEIIVSISEIEILNNVPYAVTIIQTELSIINNKDLPQGVPI
jgi:hypothetical protein